nr:acid-sensing ion channel 1C-like [Parasteatoda tepidariorum]
MKVGEVNSRSAYAQSFSIEPKSAHYKASKWDRVVNTFLQTSTLHGVNHLRPPCSRPQKGFWLLAILACSAFLFVHASVLIYNALTRPSLSTTLTLKYRDLDEPLLKEEDKITKFPGITICGLTPFKRVETEDSLSLTMYHALSLGYPYSGLTLGERIHLQEAITKSMSNNNTLWLLKKQLQDFENSTLNEEGITKLLWNSSYKCEEVFERCSVGFQELNCCSVFEPILTTFGFCYALNYEKTTFDQLEMETMPFIIDLHVPTTNTTDSEEGYLLLVHDPRFKPRMILPKDGLLVAPGVTMSLRLTLRIVSSLLLQYYYLKRIKIWLKVFLGFWTNWSIRNVSSNYKTLSLNKEKTIVRKKGGNTSYPVCGPKQMLGCVVIELSKILSDLLKECQPPCLDYIFEATSSYAQLRFNYSLQERSRISISYNTISYYHNIYHKHYLSSLFSDIGGAMGLLLGASCLTGVELLIFLGQWLYFVFFKKI